MDTSGITTSSSTILKLQQLQTQNKATGTTKREWQQSHRQPVDNVEISDTAKHFQKPSLSSSEQDNRKVDNSDELLKAKEEKIVSSARKRIKEEQIQNEQNLNGSQYPRIPKDKTIKVQPNYYDMIMRSYNEQSE